MNILGLNFGHDASLTLIVDGKLASFLELERCTRLKHTVGVRASDVLEFLAHSDCAIGEIDAVALVGTQWYKAKHSGDIHVQEERDQARLGKFDPGKLRLGLACGGTDGWYDYHTHQSRLVNPQQVAFPLDAISGGLIGVSPAGVQALVDALRQLGDAKECGGDDLLMPYQSLIPYRIAIQDTEIPAFFVPHHIAHACYGAFYRRDDAENLLIVSHDGGWPHIPFNAGGLFYFSQSSIYPLLDPNLYVGQLYQRMGELAGFKPAEAPGKLMGLASYGVVNPVDLLEVRDICMRAMLRDTKWQVEAFQSELESVMAKLAAIAPHVHLRDGYEKFDYGFKDIRFSVGVAAYTQALVEDVWSATLAPLIECFGKVGEVSRQIPVVGGFSLNCPGNAKLQASVSSYELAPLPGGSDMGTSLGAAVYLYSQLGGEFPLNRDSDYRAPAFPPRGAKPLDAEVNERLLGIRRLDVGNLVEFYASRLAEGKVFCHAEGLSEVGPRALGHRSIIAHAVEERMRDKINRHKGRENWRPLAPMVRDVDFCRFFSGVDHGSQSIYMLYTYRVVSEEIKAVTHIDQSARAQVIRDGVLYDVLACLDKQGAVPVLVNTSFNVAGEPLVETVEEIVRSFKALAFDYLYLNGAIYTLE